MDKNGFDYRLFSLFIFPRAAILNFFDVINIQNGGAREILKQK